MTKYEILKVSASVCKVLADNGISPSDYRFIGLIEEYNRLKAEGHKYAYITFYLAQQYGVSETSVYRIVKKMQECANI